MSVVIDCSVALSWYLPDEFDSRAAQALEIVEAGGGIAPWLFDIEFANTLTVATRRGRIPPGFREKAVKALLGLPIELEQEASRGLEKADFALIDKHQLTAYDATYLELARRKNLPLATLDRKLAAAARAENIEVIGI